jgi:hypothetical protein
VSVGGGWVGDVSKRASDLGLGGLGGLGGACSLERQPECRKTCAHRITARSSLVFE